MAKLARSVAMVAIVFGMPTAAFAQSAISPHLHAPPPAIAAQAAPAQPQEASHHDACQCSCCQMMQKMEKKRGDADCMQMMKMMQGHGDQEKPASPQAHEKH
jgi:hypothetical protein